MLDTHLIDQSQENVFAALQRRGFDDPGWVVRLSELSQRRREVIAKVEALRAERNGASEAMAALNKGSPEFAAQRAGLRQLSEAIKELENDVRVAEEGLCETLAQVPNLPHASVPEGAGEQDNPVVRVWGDKPALAAGQARDHVDLGEALGILDFARARKVSGARFAALRGSGARLERALLQLMLDMHSREHGYCEVWPPVLVREPSMWVTGQLPKFAEDAFRLAEGLPAESVEGAAGAVGDPHPNLYLLPTAEVFLTSMHQDEILTELPIGYAAYSACFRREAGSYGRDTRGLIRQHQFDKVELVRFCEPEQGLEQLELMTKHAEAVLQRLGLHYRVVEHCAGDLGFSHCKSFDIEVWLPGQNRYREISSCSWCGDFQARRGKIRYRNATGHKPRLVHTLNGSALALGRTLVALLEQGQQSDGSVRLPEALSPYLGGELHLRP